MIYISDDTIDRFIKEDVPYIDLTTFVLDIDQAPGRIKFTSRENAVLAGIEEVIRILEKLSIRVVRSSHSGTVVQKADTFLEGEGNAGSLHAAWKVSLNILEYCSGIATRTRRMVETAGRVSPDIAVLATRKSFPGTKELAIKAVVAGGGLPHRLGLSETILIFRQHVNFLGGYQNLAEMLGRLKARACEKKIIIEVDSIETARKLAEGGADGLQFDKMEAEVLRTGIEIIRGINPHIVIIAAGGINEGNIGEYAAAGVDAIATSSMYFGKPADIGVTIERVVS
jgi:molybdenum transport protein